MYFSFIEFAAKFALSFTIANIIGVVSLSFHANKISKLFDISSDKKKLFKSFINDLNIYIIFFIIGTFILMLVIHISPLVIHSKILDLLNFCYLLIFSFCLNLNQLLFSYSRVFLNEIFYKYNFVFALFYIFVSLVILRFDYQLLPLFLAIFSLSLLFPYLIKFVYQFKI